MDLPKTFWFKFQGHEVLQKLISIFVLSLHEVVNFLGEGVVFFSSLYPVGTSLHNGHSKNVEYFYIILLSTCEVLTRLSTLYGIRPA